jgi:WD40 repeat protein
VRDAAVVDAHQGAILAATVDAAGTGLLTGGDDGHLLHVTETGREVLATAGGRWIDQIALAPWGCLAWAYGKTVEIAHGNVKLDRTLSLESSCAGLAFSPKEEMLAIAHNGGATIVSVAHLNAEPDRYECKGAHIAITWSPDARFLISAMQEHAVHAWRLRDKSSLYMHGYVSKPRCFSWSTKGRLLATSGGLSALIWPFKGKNGPQGQMAQEAGGHVAPVSAVAWHPVSKIVAIGHRDGVIALGEPGLDRSLFMREADGGAVTHLAWSLDGVILAFGAENGAAGLIDCTGLRKTS